MTHDSIALSARTTGPASARVLTVYVEADNRYEVEDSGISRANILAHKRGFRSDPARTGTTVKEWPITRGVMGQYQTKIEYTERWRGRSTASR